jgi:hypothetical protein
MSGSYAKSKKHLAVMANGRPADGDGTPEAGWRALGLTVNEGWVEAAGLAVNEGRVGGLRGLAVNEGRVGGSRGWR